MATPRGATLDQVGGFSEGNRRSYGVKNPCLRRVITAEVTKSIFENEDDPALEARLDAQAEAELDAGKVIPHERVREWLLQLSKGNRVPPPVP
jgi:hypothetical protein